MEQIIKQRPPRQPASKGLIADCSAGGTEPFNPWEAMQKLMQYEATGLTPDRVAELAIAERENRILPEGFSCVESSDGVSLYVFHPKERRVMAGKHHYFGVGCSESALERMKEGVE